MFLFIAAVLAGLGLIVWGADRFVMGASSLARNLGVPPLIIGLTVVGVGTSAPEMFVAATAALNGNAGLAIGNAVGSNIANIALVLGGAALAAGVAVKSKTLRQEFPIMLGISFLALALMWDGELGRSDGIILMIGFVLLLAWMIRAGLAARSGDPLGDEFDQEINVSMGTGLALLWILIGLIILVVSSDVIVWGGSGIARELGVSDLVIGLTIVAVGTSLPELAASVTSAMRNEPDIAIGNVLGSNMFNLLPVLALPGLISPGAVPEGVLQRDFPVMLGLSLVFLVMAFGRRGPGRISRFEGVLLLAAFVAYQVGLYFTTLAAA